MYGLMKNGGPVAETTDILAVVGKLLLTRDIQEDQGIGKKPGVVTFGSREPGEGLDQ